MPKAFSSEVAAGSREESASKKDARLDLFRFVPFRLNRLAAEVSSALSVEYSERYGLDIPEWRVLATLGFRNDACSAQYIAHCTRTHKSTISRAVTALMKRQMVERVENEDDRREFRAAPDAQGRSAVRGTDPAAVAQGAGDPVMPLRAGAQGFCARCSARSRRASIWCRPARKRTRRKRTEWRTLAASLRGATRRASNVRAMMSLRSQ